MQKVVIFTKTLWSEPPRLRHQVARLLRDRGHSVTFVERGAVMPRLSRKWESEGIQFIRPAELIGHRLRMTRTVLQASVRINRALLRRLFQTNEKGVSVVNFNFDQFYLKDIFSASRIVTIINDDFVNRTKIKQWRTLAREQLRQTCAMSDSVLAVSTSLLREVSTYNDSSMLFLPWAERPYQTPADKEKRSLVLFFGYINKRLDFDTVEKLLESGIKMRFAGPIEGARTQALVRRLEDKYDMDLYGPSELRDLPTADVCCAICPYDVSIESVRAISAPNKLFQLLACGLPVVFSQLPHLIDSSPEVIRRAGTPGEFLQHIDFFRRNFYACQNAIRDFVLSNSGEMRYNLLSDRMKG